MKLLVQAAPLPFRKEKILAVGTLAFLAPVPLGFTHTIEATWLAGYLIALALLLGALRSGRSLTLSTLALNILGIGYGLFFIFDLRVGAGKLLPATIHLLLFTLLVKLCSIHRERDFSVALILSGFLFLASVATSFHFSIVLFLAGFLFVAWPVLVKWAVWRDLATAPDEWERDARARELPGRSSTAISVLLALAIAIPLFLLLPRLSSPYMRGVERGQEIWTGFSENVDPDVYGILKRSDKVYMRLTTEEALSRVAADAIRLRTLAFTRYENRTWIRPGGGAAFVRAAAQTPLSMPGTRRSDGAGARSLSIDLMPLGSRYVPFPVGSPRVQFGESLFRGRIAFLAEFDSARNLRLPFEPEGTIHYEASYGGRPSVDRTPPGAGDASLLGIGSDRVKAWAREVLNGIDPEREPERACRKMEVFLSTRYQYSLQIPPGGPKPIEQFLFESRAGHCENFASAMALALREIGIASRFVTGFSGGEIGLFERYVIVRGRDAHAWVEAWCGPERGWMEFDPTPADGRPQLAEVPLSKRFFQITDGVEFFYDRFILSFGQNDQVELLRQLRDRMAEAGDFLQRARARLVTLRIRTWGDLLRWGCGFLLLFLLLAAARFFSRSFRFGGGSRLPPASATYRKLQKAFRSKGRGLSPSSAPSETLAAAAGFGSPALELSREIVTAYVEESFGNARGALDKRRLAELLRGVRRAVRQGAPDS